MTVRELLMKGAGLLQEGGIDSPEQEARRLYCELNGKSPAGLFLCFRDEADEEAQRQFFEALEKRRSGVPLQHITGRQSFMGFDFEVTPDVLIPRPETELLVEKALGVLEEMKLRKAAETAAFGVAARSAAEARGAAAETGMSGDADLAAAPAPCGMAENASGEILKVLDLCTGSGCIGISIARLCPEASVLLTDISSAALAVARRNAGNAEAAERIFFAEGDLFEATAGERFDLIVSNPPYIPSGEIRNLQKEVRDHDPLLALDGGADGLDLYRRIVREAPAHLLPGGAMFLEIGFDQGAAVSALIREVDGLGEPEVFRDLAGLDRIVFVRMA